MTRRLAGLALAASLLLGSLEARAAVLYLRTSCTGLSSAECKTSMDDIVTEIEALEPQASSRLLVEIGPGTFGDLALYCAGEYGHTTFRGSGREATRLSGTPNGAWIVDCEGLEFQDLTIEGGSAYAVAWGGGGSSAWSQTNLISPAIAWFDVCIGAASGPQSSHTFYGMRFISRAMGKVSNETAAIVTSCARSEVLASDVAVLGETGSTTALSALRAIRVSSFADLTVQGGDVRITTGPMPPETTISSITGVQVGVSGSVSGLFRMYSGIIAVRAQPRTSQPVTGLEVTSGGTARGETLGTSFVVETGSGTATRIAGSGVTSPLLAHPHEGPPSYVSLDGADLFVESDCDESDCTSDTGNHAHPMIYNPAACGAGPGGPWFDLVERACRE